ncbi:MAG: hypothetical protein Kow0037_29880 [Calditrichia bacterium]
MQSNKFYYSAIIVSVYDGDTVRADIDLGLSTWVKNQKIRLARINAPEIRGAERETGLAARDFLRQQILGKAVILQTIRDRKGKYGRYLGEIWLPWEDRWININDLLVARGFARYV